jgi:hypothetical protein
MAEAEAEIVLPLPVGRSVDLARVCIQRRGWIVEGYADTAVRARVMHRGRALQARVSLEFSSQNATTRVRLCARNDHKFGPLVKRELERFNDALASTLPSEATRLARSYAQGGVDPAQDRLVAMFGQLELYADRLVTPEKILTLDPHVRAEVQSAGDIVATRGRNIAAAAAGVALFGPLGLLLGSARTQTHDMREVYLLVDGPGWTYGTKVSPSAGLAVRQFVQEINVAARKLVATPGTDRPASDDRLSQLKTLGELHTAGVLTDTEFQKEKTRVLAEP